MSLPALEIAMLLAGAPLTSGGTLPAMPVPVAASGSNVQAVPATAVPAVAIEEPAHAPPSESRPPAEAPAAAAPPAAPAPKPAPGQEEIVVTGRWHAAPGDPLEKVNAISFATALAVDDAVVGPISLAYAHAVPQPIRSGVRNFLQNLHEPDVFLNFLLQLKPGKAVATLARFAINSTLGVAGLFDIAKRRPFNLPRRPNGFADTLGFYGVKPGPFLFLPVIGPTTPRDLLGLILDRLVLPLSIGSSIKPLARLSGPLSVLKVLDRRAEFDEQLQEIRAGADPYAARRELYLRGRQAEIDNLRGRDRNTGSPASGLTNPATSR
ncbi:MAG: phospholipid-binding lipoprotein MlaA [Sphingomonadales bacterium]|jgi:phospholipid-binding lipoprotein MlaA|nr:phospholipid-binding lipoprotein MlaA [Sphingomonadales bacterium]